MVSRPALTLPLILAIAASTAFAQGPCILTRQCHPWASFTAGSWKTVRVTTETFDESGKPTGASETRTRTTLNDVNDEAYELVVAVTVEISGRRLDQEPRFVRQGYYGENIGQTVKVQKTETGARDFCGKRLNVQSADVEISDRDGLRNVNLVVSAGTHSQVLRRETRSLDAGGNVMYQTVSEATALDQATEVLGRTRKTWTVRTTQKQAKGSIVTDEVHCAEVPGGVVGHTSEEFDDQGKLIRRSKLELVEYHIAKEDAATPRRRLFQRRTRRENQVENNSVFSERYTPPSSDRRS